MTLEPFHLPATASPALVAYHALFLQDRAEQLAADAAQADAHRAARAASEAAGVGWVTDLAQDHPDLLAWRHALAIRSEVRERHREALREVLAALSPEDQAAYSELWRTFCFSDANAHAPKEHVSPSGRYRIVVTQHPTQPGRGGCSRGRVYRLDTSEPIATICRNFSHFPLTWIEAHGATGRDYLVCGADYQGQTFVDLVDGTRRDHLSSNADKGWGFCWVAHHPSPDGTRLAVEGCIWACPYEVRIFDFSDPMSDDPPRELVNAGEYERAGEWLDARTFALDRIVRRVAIDGHALNGREELSLTDDEQAALEALAEARGVDEDDLIVEVTEAGATVVV